MLSPSLFDLTPVRRGSTRRVRHVPRTSRAAHDELVDTGLVAGREALVWKVLRELGDPATGLGDTATAREIAEFIRFGGACDLSLVMTVRRALSDLKAKGMAAKGPDRACRKDGRVCNTWRASA